jgi:uncharacterized alpha-E superfamily protein
MLSRVADAIYWTSRYVERAENVARFIDVNFNLLLDSPTSQGQDWAPLVLTTGDQEWFAEHYGEPTPENVMRFLTFDRRYPNSIVSSIVHARENAQTVREIISREMFAELNMLYLTVTDAARRNEPFEEMASFYDRVRLAGNYYQGVTDATLSRGEAWHFSRLARLLERADKTSRILDVKYFTLLPTVSDIGSTYDQVGWAALLNSASALQMYRQAYQELAPSHVAEFLILDKDFPRSIHYCVALAQQSLHAITKSPFNTYENLAEKQLGQLRANLDYADIETIMQQGLHQYLDRIQVALNEIGESIRQRFFELSDEAAVQSQSQSL